MKMQQWEKIKENHHRYECNDGATLHAYNDRFDAVMPNGSHVTGVATDINDAERQAYNAWTKWVISRWKRGSLARGNQYMVPLT